MTLNKNSTSYGLKRFNTDSENTLVSKHKTFIEVLRKDDTQVFDYTQTHYVK